MRRTWLLPVAAVAVMLPAGLFAQEQPTPRPEPAPRAEREARVFQLDMGRRGRIGVVVNTAADAGSDKYGARIDAVSPGGPAEKAGLKAGDIITKFNGTALGGLVPVDDEDSGPGLKLVDLAHALDPGDTVKIEYRRGSDTKAATLVARQLDGFSFVMPRTTVEVGPKIEMGDMTPLVGLGNGHGFTVCFGDPWCSLELVTLNADLGDYFGTKDGILVVKAPSDSTLPLKSGDVILSIGGRQPTSPAHAMRILRSYESGETVSIDIMRHQRRTSVSWKVPDREHGWRRVAPDGGEQSLWVAPTEEDWGAAQRALDQTREHLQRLMERNRDAFKRQPIRTIRPLLPGATVEL
jgi:membrane-associated protease RseP (regulator of RpoE activity)